MFSLNIASTQELIKKVQTQEEIINQLLNRISNLEAKFL